MAIYQPQRLVKGVGSGRGWRMLDYFFEAHTSEDIHRESEYSRQRLSEEGINVAPEDWRAVRVEFIPCSSCQGEGTRDDPVICTSCSRTGKVPRPSGVAMREWQQKRLLHPDGSWVTDTIFCILCLMENNPPEFANPALMAEYAELVRIGSEYLLVHPDEKQATDLRTCVLDDILRAHTHSQDRIWFLPDADREFFFALMRRCVADTGIKRLHLLTAENWVEYIVPIQGTRGQYSTKL